MSTNYEAIMILVESLRGAGLFCNLMQDLTKRFVDAVT